MQKTHNNNCINILSRYDVFIWTFILSDHQPVNTEVNRSKPLCGKVCLILILIAKDSKFSAEAHGSVQLPPPMKACRHDIAMCAESGIKHLQSIDQSYVN